MQRFIPPQRRITPVRPSVRLPFAGAQLSIFVILGLALIGSGLLLRRTGRKTAKARRPS